MNVVPYAATFAMNHAHWPGIRFGMLAVPRGARSVELPAGIMPQVGEKRMSLRESIIHQAGPKGREKKSMAQETNPLAGVLTGKTAVVMGVQNEWSIAWQIAVALAGAGAKVAITYVDDRAKANAERLAATIPGMKTFVCNVQDEAEIVTLRGELEGEYGKIDNLVHSIAFAPADELKNRFLETTRDGFKLALEISVYSLIAVARELTPIMNDGGSILTMTYLGSDRVFPKYNVMGVAKAALESTVRYLAADLGEQGIRVNAISAGPLKTASARGIPGFSAMQQQAIDKSPLGEVYDVKHVAGTAVFLASDAAPGLTGDVIFVDGGYHAMGV
jgi:enoyl-[acyl-carrier protein] reductase I